MKATWSILFILSLLVMILSIHQIVTSIRDYAVLGGMFYVQIIIWGILFVVSMTLLSFGIYAVEKSRGNIKKRVAMFDAWLSKGDK